MKSRLLSDRPKPAGANAGNQVNRRLVGQSENVLDIKAGRPSGTETGILHRALIGIADFWAGHDQLAGFQVLARREKGSPALPIQNLIHDNIMPTAAKMRQCWSQPFDIVKQITEDNDQAAPFRLFGQMMQRRCQPVSFAGSCSVS